MKEESNSVDLDKITEALTLFSENHVFCPGVSQNLSIGMDKTKNLLHLHLPCERYQARDCPVWFVPPYNAPKEKVKTKVYQCNKCRSLTWYLKDQKKKKLMVTPRRKMKTQTALSKCRISILIPNSRNKRILANRRERGKLNKKSRDLEKKIEESRVSLCVEQKFEMEHALKEINKKGQEEIKKIFKEATEKNNMLGVALKKAWEMDNCENDFIKDQKRNKKGSCGNRFSPLTYRIALSVFSRSPAAYEALASFSIFTLPSVYSIRAKLKEIPSKQGIDLHYLKAESERFDHHVAQFPTHLRPPKEGATIFDEVKVIGKLLWNSKTDQFIGCALDVSEYPSIEDLYKEKHVTDVLEAEYVLQFLWRCSATKFDIIGPYFMMAKNVSHAVISSTVLKTVWALQSVGLKTTALICDGGSNNIASLRQSLEVDKTEMFTTKLDGSIDFHLCPRFKNPFRKNEWVHWIMCPSHELKNMINGLFNSQEEGTRNFTVKGVPFGWKQIIDMKIRENHRRDHDELVQVKGLLQCHIERDAWTKLNVTPARIMQQSLVLAELYGYSNPMFEEEPVDKANVMACYDFLNACNQIFENGLLSQVRVDSMDASPIQSMKKGMQYFEDWAKEIIASGQPLKNNKNFLAWQTWELLRFSVFGFLGFAEDFLARNPGKYLYPVRFNGSAVETVFSQLKYLAAGKLTSANYGPFRRSLLVKHCTRATQNAEPQYRDAPLDLVSRI